MQKRSSKRQGPKDFAETAFRVVQEAKDKTPKSAPEAHKNEVAVALGWLGGWRIRGARKRRRRANLRKPAHFPDRTDLST